MTHPSNENDRAKRVIGTVYPTVGEMGIMFRYILPPEDLGKIEDLVFSQGELEPLQ